MHAEYAYKEREILERDRERQGESERTAVVGIQLSRYTVRVVSDESNRRREGGKERLQREGER